MNSPVSLPVPPRYISPTSSGVLRWLADDRDTSERQLFELLVRSGNTTELRVPRFAGDLHAAPRAIASAMFALQRAGSIVLCEGQRARAADRDPSDTGLATITRLLVDVTRPGQRTLLSTDDGFPVARAGCSAYEAEVWAVQQSQAGLALNVDDLTKPLRVVRLRLGGRGFIVSSSSGIERDDSFWISLSHRILQACHLPEPAKNQ